jgi:hypothetical protein
MKRREVLLILATLGLMITVVLADRFLLLEKIDSLEEKVDIHNDIVTGKATYVPGHACMIRAGHEDLPADIVRMPGLVQKDMSNGCFFRKKMRSKRVIHFLFKKHTYLKKNWIK